MQEIGRLRLEVMRFTQWSVGRKQVQPPQDDPSVTKSIAIADRLIRLKEIKQLTGLSRSTIYKYVSEDRFRRRFGWVNARWLGAARTFWPGSNPEQNGRRWWVQTG